MIELTVKTLDSFNHTFSVEAESTVEQLKEKIRDALGLDIQCQRLIFCGRVLQDDQQLNECGVDDGKCLHLVQRPPPSPPSRRRDRERERERERDVRIDTAGTNTASPLRHQIRHLLSAQSDVTLDSHQSMTPTAGRMEFIRRVITEIRESMSTLRAHTGDLGSSGETLEQQPMDTDSVPVEVPILVEANEGDDDDEDEEISTARAFRRHRAARAMRTRYSRPRDLGQLLAELDLLHDDFAPYRAQYVTMLRDLTTATYPDPEREQRQRTATMICDVMHSFAHGYHAISDINFHVGQRYPRLTSEASTHVRHSSPIPMQAHINVVTATGTRTLTTDGRVVTLPSRSTADTAPTGSTNTSATPSAAAASAAGSGGFDTSREIFNVRRASATDRTPVHTTTRTFTRPTTDGSNPLQYQVEIETRGHIAIPIDNSLLNGLAAVASNLHQAQAQQDLAVAAQQAAAQAAAAAAQAQPVPPAQSAPAQPTAQTATADTPASGGTPAASATSFQPLTSPVSVIPRAEGQANQPRTFFGHTLFGRGQDQPASGNSPNPRSGSAAAGRGGHGHSHVHSHVHIPTGHGHSHVHTHEHAPAGGTAAGEAGRPRVLMDLENLLRGLTHGGGVEVVMSMDDLPALIPGLQTPTDEDLNEHGVYVTPILTNPGAAPTSEILQNVIANVLRQNLADALLLQSQNRPGAQGQTSGQNQEQSRNQGQTQNQGEPQNQGSSQGQDSNAERRQWQVPIRTARRRTSNDRAHSYTMACMVYDRYLQCESTYARRHLQERREHYQQQAESQERARAARPPAPQIQQLITRNPVFTTSHMAVMMLLLNGPVCEEAQLHAFMIAIARHLFLDPLSDNPNDPGPIPADFENIRVQLREYIQHTLGHAIQTRGRSTSFESYAENVITRNIDFLRRIPSIARIVTDVDPTASIRVMIRSRLPAIAACMMSDANNDMFAARFYSVLMRFFTDMCSLILCLCEEGFDGLLRVFDAFIAYITENYEPSTRDWLRLLSHENLIEMRSRLEPNVGTSARQYFRRSDGSMPPPACCLYQALREDDIAIRGEGLLPHICERHQRLTMPITTPPLPAPQSVPSATDSSRESSPTTNTSDEPPPDTPSPPPPDLDDDDTLGSEFSQTSDHESECPHHGDGASSSSSMSPCEPSSPSDPQHSRSEGPSPRRLRRCYSSSSTEQKHPTSEVSSPLPPAVITIGLGDSNSTLFDPGFTYDEDSFFQDDDLSVQASLLSRRRNEPGHEDEETIEIDTLTIPVHSFLFRIGGFAAGTSSRRPRDASGKILISATALRRNPNIPTELRMEQLALEQSCMEVEADAEVLSAVERLAESQRENERQAEEEKRLKRLARKEKGRKGLANKIKERESHADKKPDNEDKPQTKTESENVAETEIKENLKKKEGEKKVEESLEDKNTENPMKKKSPAKLGGKHKIPVENKKKYKSLAKREIDRPMEKENKVPAEEKENKNLVKTKSYISPERPNQSEASAFEKNMMEKELENLKSLMESGLILSEAESDLEDDYLNEEALQIDVSPTLRDSVRQASMRLAELNERESSALLNETINECATNTFNNPDQSLYSTPAASYHVLPDEFLPSAWLRTETNLPVFIPSYQMSCSDMSEPEFLTPIAYNRSENEERDRLVYDTLDNSDGGDDNGEYLPPIYHTDEPEYLAHIHYIDEHESNVGPGLITPQSCHCPNLDWLTLQEMQVYEDSDFNDIPQGIQNACLAESESIPSELEDLTRDFGRQSLDDHTHLSEPELGADIVPPLKEPDNATLEYAADDNDRHLSQASPTPIDSMNENFERAREPVFREDGTVQEARAGQPQEPFSDAYLSGMPSRKRRCVRESRPLPTLEGLMDEGLRAVGQGVPAVTVVRGVNRARLRSFLRDSVRSLVRHRTQQEPENFRPAQFQNTAAFLDNSEKPRDQEPAAKEQTTSKSDTPSDTEE